MKFFYILFEYFERFIEEIHPQLKKDFYQDLDLNTNVSDIENETDNKNN
jgi:hypothetical protein